jgi:protein-S-isoprenylcysteine O-methyltransferase Ste14
MHAGDAIDPQLTVGIRAAVITVALTVVRTALEDRTLRSELDGYEEYTHRVKYRLVPGLW